MTREEAIQILSTRDAHGVLCGYTSGVTEALDMAIEALSADTKGDLISRQWLLEVYGDYIGDNGEPKYHVPLEVVRQNIKDAPSADRPSGEWLQREIIDDDIECGVNDDATECSVCGYVFDSHYWAKTYFNYCPNCGAKMNKGGDPE